MSERVEFEFELTFEDYRDALAAHTAGLVRQAYRKVETRISAFPVLPLGDQPATPAPASSEQAV